MVDLLFAFIEEFSLQLFHMNDAASTLTSRAPEPALGHWLISLRARRIFGKLITTGQVIADACVVFVCFLVSYYLYTSVLARVSPQSAQEFLIFAAGASALYVLILDRVGLYRREVSLLNIKELRGIFYTGLYAAAFILSTSFYIRSVSLSRLTLTVALIASPIVLYLQRQIFYRLHLLFHQRGWAQRKVLIFVAGNIGTHLARRVFESPSLGILPAVFLDDDVTKHGQSVRWTGICPKDGVKIFGGETELEEAKKAFGIDLVLIALPSATFERNQRLVDLCVQSGLDYAIVPNSYEKFVQNVELFEIGGIPILRKRARQVNFFYLIVKRLIDLVLSSFLLIFFSPAIVVFAVLIKWDSPGPIIFKQKRVGLRGRQFSFYKFRTMNVESPRYAVSPGQHQDPRITRVGRWLRRTSLDELPQLFNVFRGDMSIVGPRPEMPFIVETYSPLHRERLAAKPGITGVWQISAARGEPIHANIEYDLFYLENRSLLLDLAIIVKTALSVIRGVGAV
jgi:exopolysaccharide biosynthesis polyprenyl glycosylphosphotransferase